MEGVRVELIPFQRPVENKRVLYVTGVPADLPYEEKWSGLHRAFFPFGLLYEVQLPNSVRSALPAAPTPDCTEYAFVKFYSSSAAARAQREMDRRVCLAGRLLRVQHASRRPSSPFPLPLPKCQELASHYLGFNSWSTKVISLSEEGRDEEVCYRGVVEVRVRGCEVCSVGMGVGRVELKSPVDSLQRVQSVGIAKKLAYRRACENAFSKVVIAVLPGGRVGAQVLQDAEDYMRDVMGDLEETCPPVNVLPVPDTKTES